jgi:protein gp37
VLTLQNNPREAASYAEPPHQVEPPAAAPPPAIPQLPIEAPSHGSLPATYQQAKTALAECVRIDECQSWANKAEALASYARQANDNELRRLADRIQARAVHRAGELLKEIPPATGAHRKSDGADTLSRKQAAEDAGLSERQRNTALRVASIPRAEFEAAIEAVNPPTVTDLAERGIQERKSRERREASPVAEQEGAAKEYITWDEWRGLSEADRTTLLRHTEKPKSKLNKQENADIEWADWSWNPVTGCLHDCPYCYARNIAFHIYPAEVGFAPTLWPGRLSVPAHQAVPEQAKERIAQKNIFTCSMADLFGRWVPSEWIEAVFATVRASPDWNFLFLTKFPNRLSEFDIPANAWMGTTVDLQARVANAEKAFLNVKAPVRWLSIEPMIEPLKFNRLDLFDWVVIGGASPSKAVDDTPDTPAWNVPRSTSAGSRRWLQDLLQN